MTNRSIDMMISLPNSYIITGCQNVKLYFSDYSSDISRIEDWPFVRNISQLQRRFSTGPTELYLGSGYSGMGCNTHAHLNDMKAGLSKQE